MKQMLYRIALITALAPHAWAALALQNYDAASHHRFANDPSFIGADYDWSGVAHNSSRGWVTRISDTYFITAHHRQAFGSFTFYENNDPLGPTSTVSTSGAWRIGSTDIVVGRFSASPGSSIATYSIADEATTQAMFATSSYYDTEAFVVGLNGIDQAAGTTSFRVGRNELDGFYDDADFGFGVADLISYDDDRNTPDSLGADEAYLQSGDSGAPTFITIGSSLVLTGIHLGIDASSSYDSFLPNYIDEISAIVEAGGESLTLISPVPEPSSALMLILGSITLVTVRRRACLPPSSQRHRPR